MRHVCGRVLLAFAMLCGFATHFEARAGIGNLWYDGPYVGDSPEAACAPVMKNNGWDLDHIEMNLWRGEAVCKPTYESVMRTWGYYTWTVASFAGGGCAPGYSMQSDGNCEPNRATEKACPVAHPVMPGTGTKVLTERDDGGTSELPFVRSYQSNVLFGAASGTGQWTFNWQRRLDPSMSLSMYSPSARALREDGSVLTFRKGPTGWTAVGTKDSVEPSYDANGYITEWKYIVALSGTVERYDAAGKLIRVEERNGRSTVLTYDAKNLLSQVKAASGRRLAFSHDAQGRISSITAPDGAITKYAYNANGMLTTVTWPDNTTRQYVYEDTRFPTALTGVIDEAGVRYATYAYDDQGRAITSELTAGADRYQFQFQANEQTTVLTPDGGSSVYSFLKQNGVLLPTGVSAPCPTCGSTAQSTSYDANNNPTSKTGYDGSTTTYVYDALGRETQRIEAAGTSNARTITTEWDPVWNLPSKLASPGRIDGFTYDDKGRLKGYAWFPTADSNGSQGTAAVRNGSITSSGWTYNDAGAVIAAVELLDDTVTGSWAFTYDDQGNLLTLTNAAGKVGKALQYDGAGRLLEAINTDGQHIRYQYDAQGRITRIEKDDQVTTVEYNAAGFVSAVKGPGNYFTGYEYDTAHRLTALLLSPEATPPADISQTSNGVTAANVATAEATTSGLWQQLLTWLSSWLTSWISEAHAQLQWIRTILPGGPSPMKAKPAGAGDPADSLQAGAGARRNPENTVRSVEEAIGIKIGGDDDDKGCAKNPAIPDAQPRDLCEYLALAEAKAGAGVQIMSNLGDEPRLVAHYGPGPWVKMQHKHECWDGRELVIHYFSNMRGMNVELKFKKW